MADRKDVVQGTLDLLVLRILATQPMHGWGVMQRIRYLTEDVARFYAITKAGQKQLAREKQHWRSITTAVEKVMEGA